MRAPAVLDRYRSGARPATDILVCLDALVDRARYTCASALLTLALDAVRPTPRLLWRWAASHIGVLNRRACCKVMERYAEGRGGWMRLDPAHVAESEDALNALLFTTLDAARVSPLFLAVLDHARRLMARGFNYSAHALRTLDGLSLVRVITRHRADGRFTLPAHSVPGIMC